jgi:hypothetical protein
MKRKLFLSLFICIQLFFVFFYIHDQSQRIQLSYQKQKYEKKKAELTEKRQALAQALHASHNLAAIKAFALRSHMQKIKLHQIKSLDHERTT